MYLEKCLIPKHSFYSANKFLLFLQENTADTYLAKLFGKTEIQNIYIVPVNGDKV